MSVITCISCHLRFDSYEFQRDHYKSDWHKYNLRRKIAELPPITQEAFQSRENQKIVKEKQESELTEIKALNCQLCRKSFKSFNAHKSHLQSKKHKEAEKKKLAIVQQQVEQENLLIEKDEDDEEAFEKEEKAIAKAIAEEKKSLSIPAIVKGNKSGHSKERARKLELRKELWYKKQVKLGKSEDVIMEEEEEEEEGDWEECSSDEDCTDDESIADSETKSVGESVTSATSSVSGILSRMKYDSDMDVASVGSADVRSEQREIGMNECLFSGRLFNSIEDKVVYMAHKHSFYIPELEYVSNLEGLLQYLGYKIGVCNMCIWCNKTFTSLAAVRKHMQDVGHCRMMVEGDAILEYCDFYDFSSTYEDDGADPDAQLMEVDDDAVDNDVTMANEEYERVLPSGVVIGNRKLMRYYKQSFPTVDRGLANRNSAIGKVLSTFRSMGYQKMTVAKQNSVAKRFHRDVKFVQNLKKKHLEKLGTKNNKTMMTHFRPQVFF